MNRSLRRSLFVRVVRRFAGEAHSSRRKPLTQRKKKEKKKKTYWLADCVLCIMKASYEVLCLMKGETKKQCYHVMSRPCLDTVCRVEDVVPSLPYSSR